MAKGIDFSSLTRAERVVALSGLAVFANGLVPWWYRIEISSGTYTYNAGLKGWGLVAVAAGAVAALAIVARASVWPEPAPPRDGIAYTVLGALAVIASAVQATDGRGTWIGVWVSLGLGLALALAGVRRYSERKAGWT